VKVLVIGGGGREHALVWKLARSPRITKLYCAPGNPGIGKHAELVPISAEDIDGLLKFAKANAVDLTVVGPEDTLALGLADKFAAAGLKVFGPGKDAARIESDKAFAKELMRQYKVPTADARIFERADDAVTYIRSRTDPPVVKAAGLAKGKGVVVAATHDEAVKAVHQIMTARVFGEAGARVVIEDKLQGEEASVLAITDGSTIYVLEACQDHKAVFDGDKGPNTGGMGAYCPAPVITDVLMQEIERTILVPIVHGMRTQERAFVGVLYAGLMITKGGPKVLEFNARFGDPETQPLIMRLKTDLLEVIDAAVNGRLDQINLEWDPRPALCVVLASKGYPGDYEKGKPIQGLSRIEAADDLMVFHAGTAVKGDWLVTNGGRVLGVTALGETIADAQHRAYEAVRLIIFEGMHYRTDIASRATARKGKV
jgi:phosphoribosylamine--glycine ligase